MLKALLFGHLVCPYRSAFVAFYKKQVAIFGKMV